MGGIRPEPDPGLPGVGAAPVSEVVPDEAERQGCGFVGEDGQRCRAPGHLVQEDGLCWSHSPLVAAERRAGQRLGGLSTARRYRKHRGLDEADLPPLDSPEAAQRWSEITARGVACGRMSSAQAQATMRAVAQWLAARDLHVRESRLGQLERRVAALTNGGHR